MHCHRHAINRVQPTQRTCQWTFWSIWKFSFRHWASQGINENNPPLHHDTYSHILLSVFWYSRATTGNEISSSSDEHNNTLSPLNRNWLLAGSASECDAMCAWRVGVEAVGPGRFHSVPIQSAPRLRTNENRYLFTHTWFHRSLKHSRVPRHKSCLQDSSCSRHKAVQRPRRKTLHHKNMM